MGKAKPFHGGNTGSNPVGDAKIPKNLHETLVLNQGPSGSNKLLDCQPESRQERAYIFSQNPLPTRVHRTLVASAGIRRCQHTVAMRIAAVTDMIATVPRRMA